MSSSPEIGKFSGKVLIQHAQNPTKEEKGKMDKKGREGRKGREGLAMKTRCLLLTNSTQHYTKVSAM